MDGFIRDHHVCMSLGKCTNALIYLCVAFNIYTQKYIVNCVLFTFFYFVCVPMAIVYHFSAFIFYTNDFKENKAWKPRHRPGRWSRFGISEERREFGIKSPRAATVKRGMYSKRTNTTDQTPMWEMWEHHPPPTCPNSALGGQYCGPWGGWAKPLLGDGGYRREGGDFPISISHLFEIWPVTSKLPKKWLATKGENDPPLPPPSLSKCLSTEKPTERPKIGSPRAEWGAGILVL